MAVGPVQGTPGSRFAHAVIRARCARTRVDCAAARQSFMRTGRRATFPRNTRHFAVHYSRRAGADDAKRCAVAGRTEQRSVLLQ